MCLSSAKQPLLSSCLCNSAQRSPSLPPTGGLSSPWLCALYSEAVIPACLVHTDASHTQRMQTVKRRAHVLGGHHRASEEQECGWRPARSTAPDAPGHPRQGPCSALHCGHLSVGPCAGPGRDIEWKVLTVTKPVLSASHMSSYAILSHSRRSSVLCPCYSGGN